MFKNIPFFAGFEKRTCAFGRKISHRWTQINTDFFSHGGHGEHGGKREKEIREREFLIFNGEF